MATATTVLTMTNGQTNKNSEHPIRGLEVPTGADRLIHQLNVSDCCFKWTPF
ncbi:MAG UNVERIFIED_CONTAM: hypothetical protein LVT10_25455 [Anaerolineae bacterium]